MAVKEPPMPPRRPAAAKRTKTKAKTKPTPKAKTKRAAATRAGGKRAGRAASPHVQQLLTRLRAICLALPETTEVQAWGHPTFRVKDKIFASFGGDATGAASMGVKCTMDMQSALVASDPRFTIAPYVGKHGWVHLDLGPEVKVDWGEIEALVAESYRLIAPGRLGKGI
jgi:predicted DNA-binding protein (MmcQ/YjbR family)